MGVFLPTVGFRGFVVYRLLSIPGLRFGFHVLGFRVLGLGEFVGGEVNLSVGFRVSVSDLAWTCLYLEPGFHPGDPEALNSDP